ncbi:MarR family winged helix-turn-helix transcriptional regulator [Streptomyces sp. NPDC097727]|uniref:MarR family winged helix-turn-helix transcriptional regulator n=1 Tax=Streptomyces sp. NPDC097727 TaxID=3366092 RepID=UPI003821998E
MAAKPDFEELMRQLRAMGSVRRELARSLPADCSSGSAAVLALLARDGDMRISRLAELLAVDMSVTSRLVTHLAELGWIDRSPDPGDRRSRILRLTPEGRLRLAELSDRTARLLAERLSGWSDEDVERLTGLLARLRADFDNQGTHVGGPLSKTTPEASSARTTTVIT